MGAFGEHTMTFDQWLQFVLVPRLLEIARDREKLPSGSQLAAYAVRALDGDPDSGQIHDLLSEIDRLANGNEDEDTDISGDARASDTVTLGDRTLPAVIYSLIAVLPQFEGADLESQLETYDTFLAILSPEVRPELSTLLRKAAALTTNPASRARIEAAADSVARGGHAGPE
jgi:hypothetical protein